jgi:hypothetical protein
LGSFRLGEASEYFELVSIRRIMKRIF